MFPRPPERRLLVGLGIERVIEPVQEHGAEVRMVFEAPHTPAAVDEPRWASEGDVKETNLLSHIAAFG